MSTSTSGGTNKNIIFDIETGPAPEDELRRMLPPLDLPPKPGEFDPATVKLGNLKDKAKIEEKIEAAREAHNLAVSKYDEKAATEQAEHWVKFVDKAALSAVAGRVVAIGYWRNGQPRISAKPEEEETIRGFWGMYQHCQLAGAHIIGFNSLGFDVPFLVRRSWLLGIPVPPSVIERGRYWSPVFIDLMQVWNCTSREYVGLDYLAQAFGIGGKNGDGARFAKLWATDREAAVAYLNNDLDMTAKLAERLGVI